MILILPCKLSKIDIFMELKHGFILGPDGKGWPGTSCRRVVSQFWTTSEVSVVITWDPLWRNKARQNLPTDSLSCIDPPSPY